jgi:hypothetical protein
MEYQRTSVTTPGEIVPRNYGTFLDSAIGGTISTESVSSSASNDRSADDPLAAVLASESAGSANDWLFWRMLGNNEDMLAGTRMLSAFI